MVIDTGAAASASLPAVRPFVIGRLLDLAAVARGPQSCRTAVCLVQSDFSLHSLKSPYCAPERACTSGDWSDEFHTGESLFAPTHPHSRQARTGIVMLPTPLGTTLVSDHRLGRILVALKTVFQAPYPWQSAARRHAKDLEKRGDFTCSRVRLAGIRKHWLTRELSFRDAELVQCIGKGGASFFGQGRRLVRPYSMSNARKNRLSHVCLLSSRVEEVRPGPIRGGGARFCVCAGRRPSVRASIFHRAVRGECEANPGPRICTGQSISCALNEAGFTTWI